MSAQTGTPSFVPAAPGEGKKLRHWLRHVWSTPNPLWMREQRQSARLTRTPFVLMVVTMVVAIIVCTVGVIMSLSASLATTGIALFHTFFSLAFFVVHIVGSAVAANGVASEREGRTWEAVVLTGLAPQKIAVGKFLSAFTSILMYIVMLAPVGALPLMFGGITTVDILIAFFYLIVVAILSVALGLAISSALTSGRAAILLTLVLSFNVSLFVLVFLGVALSSVAHRLWPAVIEGAPVWLPTAYTRVPFSWQYATFLLAMPLGATVVGGWYFFEITVANIQGITDDRATGLKRWLVVCGPLVTVTGLMAVFALKNHLTSPAVAKVPALHSMPSTGLATLALVLCLLVFWVFTLYVFQGEAIGPSRRVLIGWQRKRVSRWKRFLGPGMARTMGLIACMGTVSLATVVLVALALSSWTTLLTTGTLAVYVMGYFLFLCGVAAFVRSRTAGVGMARFLLSLVIFLTILGPYIVVGTMVIVLVNDGEALLLGAPSPAFAFLEPLYTLRGMGMQWLTGSWFGGGLYGAVGLLLLWLGRKRCRRVVTEQIERWNQTEAWFASEDQNEYQSSDQTAPTAGLEAPPSASVPAAPAAAGTPGAS